MSDEKIRSKKKEFDFEIDLNLEIHGKKFKIFFYYNVLYLP